MKQYLLSLDVLWQIIAMGVAGDASGLKNVQAELTRHTVQGNALLIAHTCDEARIHTPPGDGSYVRGGHKAQA